MFPAARPKWAFVLIASAAFPAFAQTASSVSQTTGPAAQVELTYRSTFDAYQRFTDEKVGSWRDANDTVGRIGGWRSYAKEAREPAASGAPNQGNPAAPTAPAAPAAPAPAANPHEGHGK